MAEKTQKTRIQHKHEPEANWLQATNFIPLAGELIIYDVDETHSKPRFKIGDGIRNPDTGKIEGTNVNDLPFVSDDFITNDELDTKLNNEYQEKFATVTKDSELTTGIRFTTDINEILRGTTRVELQPGAIELAAYESISLDTHNGPISINSNQDIVLNSLYGGIDASSKRVKNVATPTEDTDAANKKYVDSIKEELKSYAHDVGSVFITSTNENPSKKLGGTWVLIDKEFSSKSGTNVYNKSVVPTVGSVLDCSDYFKNAAVAYVRGGHSVYFRVSFTVKQNLTLVSGRNVLIGSIDLGTVGLTGVSFTKNLIGSSYDKTFRLFTYDTNKLALTAIHDDTKALPVGSPCVAEFTETALMGYMKDEACDKFYWKRTA